MDPNKLTSDIGELYARVEALLNDLEIESDKLKGKYIDIRFAVGTYSGCASIIANVDMQRAMRGDINCGDILTRRIALVKKELDKCTGAIDDMLAEEGDNNQLTRVKDVEKDIYKTLDDFQTLMVDASRAK